MSENRTHEWGRAAPGGRRQKDQAAPVIIKKKKGGRGGGHGRAWRVARVVFVTVMMALFIVQRPHMGKTFQ